jgi:hypothetical protein
MHSTLLFRGIKCKLDTAVHNNHLENKLGTELGKAPGNVLGDVLGCTEWA